MLGHETINNLRRARDICDSYIQRKVTMDNPSQAECLQRDVRSLLCGVGPGRGGFSRDIRMPNEVAVAGEVCMSNWFLDMRTHADALLR